MKKEMPNRICNLLSKATNLKCSIHVDIYMYVYMCVCVSNKLWCMLPSGFLAAKIA